jgi:outer membrane protein assembly factor BamB
VAGTLRHDGTMLRLGDPTENYGVPTVDAQGRTFMLHGGKLHFTPASSSGVEPQRYEVSTTIPAQARAPLITPDGAELYLLVPYGVVVAEVSYVAGKAPTLSEFRSVVSDTMTPTLNELTGMALDDHGGLFLSTGDKAVVYRVDVATGQMITVADLSSGTPRHMAYAGALLFVPGDPAMLYVADGATLFPDVSNHVIWAIDLSSGRATVAFGTMGMRGIADGVGTDVRFDAPLGLALADAGTMYVSDLRTVRRINLRSRAVRTLVGSGLQGLELGALPASLNSPIGIAVRGSDELWITDVGEPSVVSARAP